MIVHPVTKGKSTFPISDRGKMKEHESKVIFSGQDIKLHVEN